MQHEVCSCSYRGSVDIPRCILPRDSDKGLGGLYHGGFKAAMNLDFFKEAGITHVVNTTSDPEKQFTLGLKYIVSASNYNNYYTVMWTFMFSCQAINFGNILILLQHAGLPTVFDLKSQVA